MIRGELDYPVNTPVAAAGGCSDGRLDPQERLYCEGYEKPLLRGQLHLCAALLVPIAFLNLYHASQDHLHSQIATFIFCSGQLFCYGFSGLFHCFNWSAKTEIFLQKCDHCGIAVLSLGTAILTFTVNLTSLPHHINRNSRLLCHHNHNLVRLAYLLTNYCVCV